MAAKPNKDSAGKGDSPRPGDPGKYREGYERIFRGAKVSGAEPEEVKWHCNKCGRDFLERESAGVDASEVDGCEERVIACPDCWANEISEEGSLTPPIRQKGRSCLPADMATMAVTDQARCLRFALDLRFDHPAWEVLERTGTSPSCVWEKFVLAETKRMAQNIKLPEGLIRDGS